MQNLINFFEKYPSILISIFLVLLAIFNLILPLKLIGLLFLGIAITNLVFRLYEILLAYKPLAKPANSVASFDPPVA